MVITVVQDGSKKGKVGIFQGSYNRFACKFGIMIDYGNKD